jgi:hypothetical protein
VVDLDAVRRAKAPDPNRPQKRIAAAFIANDKIGDAGQFELAKEAAFVCLVATDVAGPVEEADEQAVPQPHHLLRKVLDVNLRSAG